MTPLEFNLSVTAATFVMCVLDPLIQQAKPTLDARKKQTAEAVAKALAQAESPGQLPEPLAIAACGVINPYPNPPPERRGA